jgi:hypothetical protein
MTARGIAFEEWGAVDQHTARRFARDPEIKPLYLRVMFAGLGWSNLIGHAEFAMGGLAMVLQSADPTTGEISIPSRSQVNAAIKRAKEMGLVHDSSDFRCLVTEAWWEKAGGKGGRTCAHHGIRSRSRRHKRSVATTEERHTRSVTATHEECRDKPSTCGDAETLYDSVLRDTHDDGEAVA